MLLPTGPAYGRSPGDPYFDPVWARLNEAKVTVAFHIMPYWYFDAISPAWGHDPDPASWHMSAWQWNNVYGERPIEDTLSAIIFDNVFGRHPDLHVPGRRARRRVGAPLRPAHGQEPRHGPQRAMDRRQAHRAALARSSAATSASLRIPEDDIPWIVDNLGQRRLAS